MKVSFYCRKSRKNINGLSPIYVRVQLKGEQYDRATQLRCVYEDWSPTTQTIKGKETSTKALRDLKEEIFEYKRRLDRELKYYELEDFKKYFGKEITTLDVLQEFKIYQLAKDNSPGTKRGDVCRLNLLTRFFTKYTRPLKDFNASVCEAYILYLESNHPYGRATLQRHNKFLNLFLKWCYKKGYVDRNLSEICVKVKPPEKISFLTSVELDVLRAKTFSSQSLNSVKDVFLFACNTGLSYSDLASFNSDDVMEDSDGDYYIDKIRQKTKGRCFIPLTQEALGIIDKYDCQLPVLSQDKYNKYIRECMSIIGVEKRVTSHMARRTCGMLLLNNGIGYEVVAKVLGHASSQTTRGYYARYLPETIIQDYKTQRNANEEQRAKREVKRANTPIYQNPSPWSGGIQYSIKQ